MHQPGHLGANQARCGGSAFSASLDPAMQDEPRNSLAYGLMMPALAVMTVSGAIPLAFVGYYSLHDTFGGNVFSWVGTAWFEEILVSAEFHGALARSLGFSALVLAVEIPLGVFVALRLPPRGFLTSACIVMMTIPLLTPSIVVGHLWTAMTLPKAGLLYEGLAAAGIRLNMNSTAAAWAMIVVMDCWHWTSLVVLLCFAGLRAIPEDYYRAARIDGASRCPVFRFIRFRNSAMS